MKNITILGYGSFATALSMLLDEKGHNVTIWGRNKDKILEIKNSRVNSYYLPEITLSNKINFVYEVETAVLDADIIVLAVPSTTVGSVCELFAPYINEEQIIVNVAKGLDTNTTQRLSVIVENRFPNNKFCVLSGPSHAEELAKFIPSTCVVASKDIEAAKIIQEDFNSRTFRLYTNTDVVGVEIGGALKNVIAIACGMSDGLGFGDNSKAALMTRATVEIGRLGVSMGGDLKTFAGLSGIGDLIATCTSVHSRNRRCGILLAKGNSIEDAKAEIQMVVEGITTAKVANLLAKKYNVKMPIIEEVNNVLFNGKDIKEAMLSLMERDMISE